ncbi:MAG: translational GTPase TypA [Magnetococcales bacterium]|nr:translational GTPase TypA [Magnetococcales bacterium]MBF0150592.1 translational GTPase TypA [Magnetococcales bacterium]MBF0171843.1 translational GTPase TypA [Magnetococcales bacterium]MBF0346115.1 translational GTPase TypA [Magnetococcales bacterium]MBF0632346.1 translational GTPase TypA [Magnetococcales bacterium]
MIEHLRNIAIIAHVDHGKTTLVDRLLQQSGTLHSRGEIKERIMDSNDLERERGITILAKNTAIRWKDFHINIVDTPGHADFGGEVERVLSMVDSVLLLVDAVDGPMPQTRFVTRKAFAMGFKPIVVINKVDRPGARPHWVYEQTFELFDRLGATEEQLDFPVIYTSALEGYASRDEHVRSGDMTPLFEAIVGYTPPPTADFSGPFQMRVSSLDYSPYVGLIGIGRVHRGRLTTNSTVTIISPEGELRSAKINHIYGFLGLEKVETQEAHAGQIICFTGSDRLVISDTLCHPEHPDPLPPLTVDEPTVVMTFQVNDSPLAGREGKYVTSRKLRERLFLEAIHNVALRVEETENPDRFRVSGRGELHLGILIENMRREGYELGVSRPEAIIRQIDGAPMEPYEQMTVDVEDRHQGAVMEALGERKGLIQDMVPDGRGRVRLDYIIPARGLIGFQTEFRTMTSGTGILHHLFDHYGPLVHKTIGQRKNGVLIAKEAGRAVAYALWNLQERGRHLIGPGEEVYEGMIIGLHTRDNDLVVNVLKAKQLTNIRAAGSDENIVLTPPIRLGLEQALEFIDDDELVEVTPKTIRLRKKLLKEHERKRDRRGVSV